MEHIKNFPESFRNIYELLRLAETPHGFFEHLVRLVNAIKSEKSFHYKLGRWMEVLNSAEVEIKHEKEQVIKWMEEKSANMRDSIKAGKPQAQRRIDQLEKILLGEIWGICSGGYIEMLTYHFSSACAALASYGPCKICDQWLKFRVRKDLFMFEVSALNIFPPKGCEKKMINSSCKEGKRLEEHLQHGFVRAIVLPNEMFFDDDESVRIEVEFGEVTEIMFPKEYYAWRKKIESSNFQAELDVNGDASLKWLLLLCRYPEISLNPTRSIPKPNTVIEADKICNEQLLQFYLSGFNSSSWEDAPLTKEEILKIVDRFLLLLQTRFPFNFPGKARTQQMKEADEYAYNTLLPHIRDMSEESKLAFTNDQAHEFVQKTNPGIYISKKATNRACKMVREETGWKTKPGKKR
ncbi:MAG: hypothetical protein WB791_09030 [Waddliaceae bacterium]